MAANDEFPRGWTLNGGSWGGSGGAAAPVLTVPALQGIAHVLTDVWGVIDQLYNGAGVQFQVALQVSSTWGTIGISFGPLLVPAASFTKDSFEWSGKLITAPGEGLTATYSAGPGANIGESLTIAGYSI